MLNERALAEDLFKGVEERIELTCVEYAMPWEQITIAQ